MMKGFFVLLATMMSLSVAVAAAPGPKLSSNNGINSNKHNLSSKSQAAYRATNLSDPKAGQICIFCHTPHNSAPQSPLWSRRDTEQSFGHYSSSSLKIHTDSLARSTSDYKPEPNGSSRLCLSCHDGVTALGALRNGDAIEINNSATTTLTGSSVFDRSKITNSHHPVSFIYNGAVKTRLNILEPANGYRLPSDPIPVPEVKLDKESRMQCITCHDPHQTQTDDPLTPFWVLANGDPLTAHDNVCRACHNFTAFPHL